MVAPSGSRRSPIERRSRPVALQRAGLTAFRIAIDLVAILGAFAVSYRLYLRAILEGLVHRPPPAPAPYAGIALVFGAIALTVFWKQGMYRRRATVLNLGELQGAVRGLLIAVALFFALLFLFKLESFSRFVIVGAIALTTVFLVLERRLLAGIVRRFQLRRRLGRRTLIYGSDRTGHLLMKKLVAAPYSGFSVVGFLDDHVPVGRRVRCRIRQTDPELFEAPVLGRLEDLDRILVDHDVDRLLVVASAVGDERQRRILEACRERGLEFGVVPGLGDVRSDQLVVEDLSAIPVLWPRSPSNRPGNRAAKRAFDLIVASALMIVTAPLWAAIALLVRWDSPGPVFFTQWRVGRGGKPFRMHKFRTMKSSAPSYGSSPAYDVDPNVTSIGRLLRRTGLDELPQLLNVLRGEMSLVGPRPEMPHLVAAHTPLERQRLLVRPGITGLWQLSADRHAEIHENIEYDLYYVSHQTLLLDVLILLETAFFTVGLVLGLLERRSPHPAANGKPAVVEGVGPDEPYLLVVLDQRVNGSVPSTWRTWIPAAYAVSDRWPVRVVVAEDNHRVFDDLLREPIRRFGVENRQSASLSYRSRDELLRWVRQARLVLTDLPHVAGWARETGVGLVFAHDGALRWSSNGDVPTPVRELANALTVQACRRGEGEGVITVLPGGRRAR